MFDANTGYAIDSAGNIWKTINGAVDWSDTGDNYSGPAADMTIFAFSATIAFIQDEESVYTNLFLCEYSLCSAA